MTINDLETEELLDTSDKHDTSVSRSTASPTSPVADAGDESIVFTPNQQLPPDFRLLPGETLVSIVTPPVRTPQHMPSSLREVMRLTGATNIDEIGRFGPSIAALALQTGEEVSEHLRLYETLFGRDSLRVAMSLIDVAPQLARATIYELSRHQGTVYEKSREEEPGRIVHEVRDADDPIARELTETRGWGWPYYGTVDATPEFIRTLAAYCKKTGDYDFLNQDYVDRDQTARTIAHALERALTWIEARLTANPEGLLEHKAAIEKGIENQVWKDSWDSYSHADGTVANHRQGIASFEVQVSVYDALIDAAELLEQGLQMPGRALQLRLRAEALRDTILDTFWTEDKGGYFVLGTDRDDEGTLRQLKVRASNMGHVLNSRLLESHDPEIVRKKEAVIRQLFTPELLGRAGIRTLASDEVRYRPGSYHNGSVWLWDTHYIATGLRRHEREDLADDLDQRLLDVVTETRMLPEYARGDADTIALNRHVITIYDETSGKLNTIEQLPQEVQAWTAAAVLEIKTRLGRQRRLRTTIAPRQRETVTA